MNKQKIGLGQGILIILAGFVGWYVLTAANSILLNWLATGPLLALIFVVGVLLFPLAPVPVAGSIIFLFSIQRKYPFSPWLAWGVLAAYLFNFLASSIFPPVLSLSFGTLSANAYPNGFLGAYILIPFFMH